MPSTVQVIDNHEVRGNLTGIPMETLRTVLNEAFAEFEANGKARIEFPLPNGLMVVVIYPHTNRSRTSRHQRGYSYAMVSGPTARK